MTYLLLPNLVLLATWFKWPVGALLIPLLIWALRISFTSVWHRHSGQWSWSVLGVLLIVGCAWSACGGAGHLMYANQDWQVRDALYGDLIYGDWPPAYGMVAGKYQVLRSAVGYFLPPALVTKFIGIGYANIILYAWTALGTCLFLLLLPLPRRSGPMLLIGLLIVILFSGMDYLGILLKTGDTPIFPLRLEWWVPFSYSSLSGQLFWAPNHTLPLWIGTALLIRHWSAPELPSLLVLLLPALAIWTPFAPVGLLPYALLALSRNRGWIRLIKVPFPVWLAGLALAWLVFRLLTLSIEHIPAFPTSQNALAQQSDSLQFAIDYFLFVIMEFGALAFVISRNKFGLSNGLLPLSICILLALPLYLFGPSNDSMLRLSVPPLLILMIASLALIQRWVINRVAPRWPIAFLTVLFIGAHTPFNELFRAMTLRRQIPDYRTTFIETQPGGLPAHYVGILDRPDLEFLLATPHLVPGHDQRPSRANSH